MLGTWNNTLADLELKENEFPVRLQPYPVPRVYEVMLKK